MREVSTKELKDALSEWVRLTEAGERVVITRSGRPVAALVPLADLAVLDSERVLAELAARGAVRVPAVRPAGAFAGEAAPARGRSASAMVFEDRG